MTTLIVGDYDASTFVDGDFGTYPPLPVGAVLYQPTLAWRVSVAGTVQGQAAVPGDLLFATQGGGRLFGDHLFGDQIFGGLSDGGWTVDQVFFLKWDSTPPPPDLVPYPNAGVPFTANDRSDMPDNNWAPGWRIVVDAYFNNPTGSRTYGTDRFGGDGVYGDVDDAGGLAWQDITAPGYRIEIGDGMALGTQRVQVSEVVVELFDDDGLFFDLAVPEAWYLPSPGTPLRVGLIDPFFEYHPLISAEIERIEDVHDYDTEGRVISVRGFGRIMDLTVDYPNITYNAELASTRFNHLVAAAGWRWGDPSTDFPPSGDDVLLADLTPRDAVIRDEIDRALQSVGWFLDSDRRGRLRVREWPHVPQGDPLIVVDIIEATVELTGAAAINEINDDGAFAESPGGSGLYELTEGTLLEAPVGTSLYDVTGVIVAGTDAGARLATSITFADDQALLLNVGMTTNTASPTAAEVVVEEPYSRSVFGARGRAMDFPKTGMWWSSTTSAEVWMRRVINRFAWVTKRVESFTVDTANDHGWLEELASLDTGRACQVQRRGVRPLTLDAVIVGWRHLITPGNWQSQIFTSTTTTSM